VLREALRKAAAGETLTEGEAERALETIMEGTVPPAATAALLTALRVRGESVSEIVGFARTMRRFAARVEAPEGVVDTCGTGGDAKGTINISTAAAFVARGAGVTIAKHGNRAATSQAGSADVLEALGAEIELGPEGVSRCIKEAGIGFMFARTHHPAMKFVAPVRAELPFRTIFNLLGPLTNPAGAKRQLVGVFGGAYVRPVAEALRDLGAEKALVVHGTDGMDEITITDKTLVAEVGEAGIEEYEISPEDFGFSRYAPDGLLGGDAHLNARILRDVLSGEETGAARDVILLNAGAAIYVSGNAKTIEDGVSLAAKSVSSGAAPGALEEFLHTTRRIAGLA
jgi:anthranilate phosphoribosyltransferase